MALSVAMAAMLALPMVVFAQNSRFDNGGLFGTNPAQTDNNGLMMSKGLVRSLPNQTGTANQAFGASDGGLTFHDFGDTDAPLGGGIAILLLAGAGYVALKNKED